MEYSTISLRDIQKLEINILKEFDAFCQKEKLTYYIAYGSLIGTIRHHGFIPWDDDVDIVMPREDYEKLIDRYEKITDRYVLFSMYNKEHWPYAYAKCVDMNTEMEEATYKSGKLGVYMDIFPLDGVPEDSVRRMLHLQYVNFLHYLLITVQKNNLVGRTFFRGMVKRMLYPVASLIGMDRLIGIIDKRIKKYKYADSKYVAQLTNNMYIKGETMRKECYGKPIIRNFEGLKVKVPRHYDHVLRRIYGDYMQLPPEEERVTHHAYKVKMKENG